MSVAVVAHGDPTERARLCRLLAGTAADVVEASSAADALGRVLLDPPALVIGDLFTSDETSASLTHRLRRELALAAIPVVLVTPASDAGANRQPVWTGWQLVAPGDEDAIVAAVHQGLDPGARPPGLAHELNNLLTGMIGFAELIGTRIGHDDVARADLARLLGAAHRAAVLTGSFLTRHRPEAPSGLQSLPLAESSRARSGGTPTGRILVVLAARAERFLVDHALRRAGHRVLVATTPAEGASLIRTDPADIGLVIVDESLLHGSREALASVAGGRPLLLLSNAGAAADSEAIARLRRPFTASELLDAVARILAPGSTEVQ